jgi:hypothetical protein
VYSKDEDTLFPLQGALGYEITQTLFVGKRTLLVEGPSDIVYLNALSYALKGRRRIGLDTRWTLCPSGGIGNIRAFVSLFGGNKIDVTVLADQSKGEKRKIEELRKSAILKAGRVFTIADFTGKGESDVEDILDPTLFVRIVNAAFRLPAANALTVEVLTKADPNTERQVLKAEAAFKVLPPDLPTYDHFSPAAWLLQNPKELEGESPEILQTLNRAEEMFKTVNAVLS